MEKRAIQVSHELWAQMMTEGYTSGGIKCIEGLPEDARFVTAFYKQYVVAEDDPSQWASAADPVFVFASEMWPHATEDYRITTPWGEMFLLFEPVFQAAECRTCGGVCSSSHFVIPAR